MRGKIGRSKMILISYSPYSPYALLYSFICVVQITIAFLLRSSIKLTLLSLQLLRNARWPIFQEKERRQQSSVNSNLHSITNKMRRKLHYQSIHYLYSRLCFLIDYFKRPSKLVADCHSSPYFFCF